MFRWQLFKNIFQGKLGNIWRTDYFKRRKLVSQRKFVVITRIRLAVCWKHSAIKTLDIPFKCDYIMRYCKRISTWAEGYDIGSWWLYTNSVITYNIIYIRFGWCRKWCITWTTNSQNCTCRDCLSMYIIFECHRKFWMINSLVK